MRRLLQRRGYKDWVGEVEGYGSTLEIRAVATRMHEGVTLAEDRLRANAPAQLEPPRRKAETPATNSRIQSLMAFSDAFKRTD